VGQEKEEKKTGSTSNTRYRPAGKASKKRRGPQRGKEIDFLIRAKHDGLV